MTDAESRRVRIVALLADGRVSGAGTNRLCQVCAEVTDMTGAGIMLMTGSTNRGSVCVSDDVSELIEQLQYTLGEGPCVDAYHEDRPVLEPHLADPAGRPLAGLHRARSRRASEPCSASRCRSAGCDSARSTSTATGPPLTEGQHADALLMAGLAAQAVLDLQADAQPGTVATTFDPGVDFKYVVHQAAGMMAVQLDVPVGDALIRLRAYAFGNELPLAEVAAAVVARTLRFDDMVDGPGSDA